MALNTEKDLKMYFSTKEVADMFSVNESTLRFWETVFPSIRPKTTAKGTRQYVQKNIDEIRVVHNLVKVRGFKLEAAAEMLKKNRNGVDKTTEVLDHLSNVSKELSDIKKHLDDII